MAVEDENSNEYAAYLAGFPDVARESGYAGPPLSLPEWIDAYGATEDDPWAILGPGSWKIRGGSAGAD
jgi:hypothetical protein